MTILRWLIAAGMFVVAASTVSAQTPSPSPPAPSEAAPAQEAPPAPPPDYTYSIDGRRDPFVRTIGRLVASTPTTGARPQGIAGLLVGEVIVRGFLESRGAWVAMVGAPNGRSYTLRTGDRLMDGTVREITSEAVVFLQHENDPLSTAKQREVRKYLRGGEQGQ